METINTTLFLIMMRLLTLVVGVLDLVLTAHSYYSEYNDEIIFLIIVIFCLIFSLILLCGYLSELLTGTLGIKYVDVWFHIGGALGLFITGIFMMAAAVERSSANGLTVERTISALLGIQNAVVYGIIGVLLFKTVPSPPSKYGEGLEWEDPLIETVKAKKADFGSFTTNR